MWILTHTRRHTHTLTHTNTHAKRAISAILNKFQNYAAFSSLYAQQQQQQIE